ncbi:MAG: efflux transporter outer membrane subunit [Gemmatimonadota bacterium]
MRNLKFLALLTIGACGPAAYQPPPVQVAPAFREAPESTTSGNAVKFVAASIAHPDSMGTALDSWRQLGDTTLDRLLDQALQQNFDARAAAARVRGARSARTRASLDLAPTVTAAGSYTRQRISSAAFPIGGGTFPDQDIWDAGFDASWELDLFGRLRRNLQAEGAFVSASEEDLRNVRVSLAAEVARAYFELRGAQDQLAVTQKNADNQRRTLEVTHQRLDAGRGTAFDTERAQAQLSFTLAAIPPLEASVAAAKYRIGVLVGRSPATVAAELTNVAAIPQLPRLVSIPNADSLIRRRPDVAAAERVFAAQRALVGAAKAAYLPQITVGASAGYASSALSSFGDHGTFRYAVGPVISWPALNLGRVKAGVDASQARASEAESQYAQTVLLASEEVENALAGYRSAAERVVRIDEAATASGKAAELAQLRFTEGVADFLQVLDAERTQLDAERQLAEGRTQAATAFAALVKALGGSWPD